MAKKAAAKAPKKMPVVQGPIPATVPSAGAEQPGGDLPLSLPQAPISPEGTASEIVPPNPDAIGASAGLTVSSLPELGADTQQQPPAELITPLEVQEGDVETEDDSAPCETSAAEAVIYHTPHLQQGEIVTTGFVFPNPPAIR